MRLNKYIAHSGYCSRRKADDLIFSGEVRVNDSIITNPATFVTNNDTVYVESKLLKIDHTHVYYLLNKPLYTITSAADEKDRETVVDLINCNTRIYPIGRLDYMTTGVLLLTNDGDLTQKLSHPSTEIKKMYEVKVRGNLSNIDFQRLENGIKLDNQLTYPAKISSIKRDEKSTVFNIEIHEGRNRQIRRMIDEIGFQLLTLDRIYYAGINYGNLARGDFRELTATEINALKKQAGIK